MKISLCNVGFSLVLAVLRTIMAGETQKCEISGVESRTVSNLETVMASKSFERSIDNWDIPQQVKDFAKPVMLGDSIIVTNGGTLGVTSTRKCWGKWHNLCSFWRAVLLT